jgi:hypothetical protein
MPCYLEEAFVLFRQQTLLPLDDCLYALRHGNPGLSRTTLHRYFRRSGLNSLAALDGARTARDFASKQIGYVHVGLMKIPVRTGAAALLNGFDRVSKFAFGVIEPRLSPGIVAAFVHRLIAAVPFRIHTLQTSNDPLFEVGDYFRRVCAQRGITHRVVCAPRIEQQAEAHSCAGSLEDPGCDFETIQDVQQLLAQQLEDYNNSCKLKSLRGLTPVEFAAQWARRQASARLAVSYAGSAGR